MTAEDIDGLPVGCPLSYRQFEVLELAAEGLALDEIVARLGITRSTVRTHLLAIRTRLDAHTTAQAVAIAGRRGWIGWTGPIERVLVVPPAPPAPRSTLADTHPFLAGVAQELERWARSGFADQDARDRMHLGARAAGARPRRRRTHRYREDDPVRALLEHVADATLYPSPDVERQP